MGQEQCSPDIDYRRGKRPQRSHDSRRFVLLATLTLMAALGAVVGASTFAAEPTVTTPPAAPDMSKIDWPTYATTPVNALGPNADKVKRGKYLVTISGCNDCHTPLKMGAAGPELDMSRMLSGHPEQITVTGPARSLEQPYMYAAIGTNTAWSGPWGVSFTANLTPDSETGLGKWTLRNFKDTIRSGRHQGRGREILPPMPIPMYMYMTDEDLEAVFSYLQTIPSIKNQVPEPLPPAAGAPGATS